MHAESGNFSVDINATDCRFPRFDYDQDLCPVYFISFGPSPKVNSTEVMNTTTAYAATITASSTASSTTSSALSTTTTLETSTLTVLSSTTTTATTLAISTTSSALSSTSTTDSTGELSRESSSDDKHSKSPVVAIVVPIVVVLALVAVAAIIYTAKVRPSKRDAKGEDFTKDSEMNKMQKVNSGASDDSVSVSVSSGDELLGSKASHDADSTSISSKSSSQQNKKKLESWRIFDVEVGKEIGAGSFGTVYHGTWNGAPVAVKTLSSDNSAELIREAMVLKILRHPNIVQFFGIFENPQGESYMVTEFVEGGNLEHMLRTQAAVLSEKRLIRIALEVAAGMRVLEQKGVIHRDLAARNILVDTSRQELTAKVSDFGMSRISQDYVASKGTPFPIKWSAPEVIQYHKFSLKSDIWSMGVVIWEIFSYGKVPYVGMSNKEAADWVIAGNRMTIPPNITPQLSEIITRAWRTDPNERPTFVEIYNALFEILQTLGGSSPSDVPSQCSSESGNRYQDAHILESSASSSVYAPHDGYSQSNTPPMDASKPQQSQIQGEYDTTLEKCIIADRDYQTTLD